MGTSVSVVSYYIVHSISRLTCQWRMAQSFLLTTLFFCFLSQGSSLSIFIPRPTAPPVYPWSLFIPNLTTSTKLPNTIPTECCKTLHFEKDVFQQIYFHNKRPVYKHTKEDICIHYEERWVVRICDEFVKVR